MESPGPDIHGHGHGHGGLSFGFMTDHHGTSQPVQSIAMPCDTWAHGIEWVDHHERKSTLCIYIRQRFIFANSSQRI